uniref:Uncharacterized protein n=1 Tax=viral metagenome TaxID=1070528 RepID=A0A6M3LLU1_9ZZZZ
MAVTWKKLAYDSDLTDHTGNTTTAHGAVSAATASKIVVRDAEGQAAFAAPAAAGDALIKGTAATITEMAALTTGKIWQGVASRPSEVDMPSGGYTQGARVYHNATQSVADTTWTDLAFNSERYDTDTIHDTVTNNGRLVCKTAGKYVIAGCFRFSNATGGDRYIRISLNGEAETGIPISYFAYYSPPADVTINLMTLTIYDLAVNDYVTLQALQTSGGAVNVVYAAQYTPEFMMGRIG